MKPSRGPLIFAIVLLLLPVLYVGSYFALVVPQGIEIVRVITPSTFEGGTIHYRLGGKWPEAVFWPLEQIDRKVRPEAWLEQTWLTETLPHSSRDDIVSFAENPGVANVERLLPGEPKLVHLRNWHYVKKEDFAANSGLTGDELDHEYDKTMTTAANVHKSLLLILANADEVFIEGLTDENQEAINEELHSLAAYHTLLRRKGGEDPDHELTLLRLGAAAELALDGKPIKLLPAEGAEHEAARPKDGQIDDKLNGEREAAIVGRILAKGKTAFVLLGGDHDLTEAIKPTGWGYVRVTPKGYPEP